MKAESIHKYRKPQVSQTSSSIFVGSTKHKRRLQRVQPSDEFKRKISPEEAKILQRKNKRERIRNRITSVMFGILMFFILVSLLIWVAMK